ncbi:MAG: hypothetical protein KIC46_04970 [Clostridiales bacterium]|nr:hypothetical protein [Clostridiales bacterium]
MPIWIEAALGLAAVALCAVACWREDALVAWEDKCIRRWANHNERGETSGKDSKHI